MGSAGGWPSAFGDVLRAANPWRRRQTATCRLTIVGDSHTELFDCLNKRPLVLADGRVVDANVAAVKGATIRGFGRKRSTLDVKRKSLGAIRPDDDAVVFAHGQVDIELGYFYRIHIKREALEFDTFAKALAEGYVERILAHPMEAVPIVKGVNLSVLTWSREKAVAFTSQILFETPDDEDLRKAMEAELWKAYPPPEELDRRHRQYNTFLRQACAQRGVAYFDFVDATTDKRTGHVQRRWVPKSFNHHARRKRSLYRIVRRALGDVLVEAVPPKAPAKPLS
ncbi:MAG: hypothetical protein AAGF49_15110 [Pseudomonadota bacterium]